VSPNPISLAIVVVLAGLGVLLIGLARLAVPGMLPILLAVIVLAALKMARQWEQAVVLRAAQNNRCEDRGLGDPGQVGRDPRCPDPRRAAGCDEPAGAGRA